MRTLICPRCGREFRVKAHRVVTTKSCSLACKRARLEEERDSPEMVALKQIRRAMISRCYNQKNTYYRHYGGRGITVCPKWIASTDAFIRDVGLRPSPKHTLDRVDNDRGYEPGNVRWATRKTQQNNRRANFTVKHGDKVVTLTQLAESSGLNVYTLRNRLLHGEPPESAVSRPVRRCKTPTVLTATDFHRAKRMAKSGKSQREIAERLGCDKSHVSRVLSGKVKRFA